MVSPDSRRISRVPRYSGIIQNRPVDFDYRTFTLSRAPSQVLRLSSGMVTVRLGLRPTKNDPTTPPTHRRKAVTRKRFRLFPFRSPLLGESHSLSSPPLT